MPSIKFLSDANQKSIKGTALLRLDFNTEDDWRMATALPTLRFLLGCSSKIVVMSHRGRPENIGVSKNGKIYNFDKKLSLKKDAVDLSAMLHRKIFFIRRFNFDDIKKSIENSPRSSVFMLENLRFLGGEEKDDIRLAKSIASLADFYVNEAFAVCHRKDASVSAITRFLPSYAGFELEKEIKFLSHVMQNPKKPFIFLLGGGKAKDKLGMLKYFKRKADWFLLGGAPANTFAALSGVDIRNSSADEDRKDLAALRPFLKQKNLLLPVDFVFGGGKILDIGPKTAKIYSEKISRAGTVLWNGPMGFIEKKPYDKGTFEMAKAIARNRKAFSLSGGGETVMFLKKHKLDAKFSFISTGGGAMLDFLAGEKLPGIEALKNR